MSGSAPGDIPDLRQHLLTEVLPFWAKHSIDYDCGGFITHLARDGAVTSTAEKFLVPHTRLIYSFATGAALGGPEEWLSYARQGAAFFLRHFRDVEHDGWYWSVSRKGAPRQTHKRMYGHAFAIYGLSEFARISGDSVALAAADHTWSLVTDHFWDEEHGGIIENCSRNWEPTDRDHTMGTHMHLLEALLALDEASGGQRYRAQVRQIADLMVGNMVDPQHRCGIEKFHPDWRHNTALSRNLVNYGHNLEAAWLLLRVHRREGDQAYRDTARDFLDYVLRFGLDATHGGVFSHGPFGGAASEREKVFWVQTEALVAFLLGYLVFDDRRYWDAFRNVVTFCLRCLHDPQHGEWYPGTTEDGVPRATYKGSEWKAAYHVTQALAYADAYLSEIGGGR